MRGLLAGALAVAVLVGLGGPAFALDAERRVSQYSHEVWKDEDGLPQNTVFSLVQTRDGYLWAGTWEGLVRFDGVRFTVFDRQDSSEFRDVQVRALAEDGAGVLWVGTARGLLSYREGRFQRMPAETGLREMVVNALAPVGEEALWVGTARGLFLLRGGQVRRYGTEEGLPDEEIRSLWVDSGGVLWVGTTSGLARLSEGRVEPVALPEVLERRGVKALHQGPDGAMWVGLEEGLVRLDESGIRHFTRRDGLPDERVSALRADRHGNLWVGTDGGWLVRYAGGSFEALGPSEGFSGGRVMSLLEDGEGSLWVGSRSGGLNRLRDGPLLPFGVPEGFASELFNVVLEDGEGALWVGTYGQGLYRMKEGVFTHYGAEQGLSDEHVRALAEDREGTLWVGTTGGAFRFDGRRFHLLRHEQGLPHYRVASILADSRGEVWFGTSEGLGRLRQGTLTSVDLGIAGAGSRVISMAEDVEGVLWLGTLSGLVRLEGDTPTRYSAADGLLGDRVLDVYADPRGGVWVGTSQGLTLVRGGRFTRFSSAQGLSADGAFRILEDAHGHLWMSNNKGLSRVSRSELEEVAEGRRSRVQAVLYDRRDGMRSAECSGGTQPAGWRARDGHLWFPTVRGLVRVDPERAEGRHPEARVHLEELRVHGQPVPLGPSLVLQPGQTDVEFRFTALALRDSSRLPLRFRLEGRDARWVDAEGRRSATYTHLPPGDYRFVVMAANRDGVWTRPGASVAFTVVPLFHQTLWFYALCTLGVVALGSGAYALRVGRLKERERQLEARVVERTRELASANRELDENLRALRQAQSQLVQAGKMAAVGTLAAGVGHEINNPLAYIVSNLEFATAEAAALERELPADSAGRRRLEDMERALRESLHGADRVRRIVKDLKTFSRGDEETRGPVDLHAVLDSAAKLAGNELRPRARLVKAYGEACWVDGNESRLAQVFLNLLINAAHALPEGQAERHEVRLVTRREGEERVVAEVRDTGSGIAPDVLGRIFDPFFTTKPVGVGTGLGLALCHRFVTAMGGAIAVESEPGRGTVVRVVLRAAAAPVHPAGRAVQEQQKEGTGMRGRILVVDDDPMVSAALRRTLAREHEVEVVTSARAALALLTGPRGAELDLILCDLMMPELTGMELHEAVSVQAPAVAKRMVFVTGGAFTPAARAFLERVENARVDKPFEPAKLREQVHGWVRQARTEAGRAA